MHMHLKFKTLHFNILSMKLYNSCTKLVQAKITYYRNTISCVVVFKMFCHPYDTLIFSTKVLRLLSDVQQAPFFVK